MEIAIITGTRCSAIRLSSAVNKVRSGPSVPTMNGASVPSRYCLETTGHGGRVGRDSEVNFGEVAFPSHFHNGGSRKNRPCIRARLQPCRNGMIVIGL